MTVHAKREHARILFPMASGPQLQTNGKSYAIVDLSSGGVRFRLARNQAISVGSPLRGRILFRPGKEIEVKGKVLRVSRGHAAARLEEGVPYNVILAEQHYPLEHRGGMAW